MYYLIKIEVHEQRPVLETRIGAEHPLFERCPDDLAHLRQRCCPAPYDYAEHATLLDAAFGVCEQRPQDYCVRVEAHSPFREVPYLIHTGFELPLMLDGLKPLAVFSDLSDSAVITDARARFAPFVAQGRIVLVEQGRTMTFDGRSITMVDLFYHLPGEGWRVPVLGALRAEARPWGEAAEEIEGLLLGYSPAQNGWWRERSRREAHK
ncbi:hypothetical protein BTR14_09285 [Rhizobium rhizosphaerae]|uniref:Uncharacterized protein n=1 Tax=Xaviernesmea rhizosphaerae TaxID=1672749 RepID=A0ABX3PEY0_9HYPH|nr:hypothetical protein [Xaviernesmea rhizosphaerae]OQP86633.1 hypothetical protein BTR14_09285 [Xaviernesmea rhizosphaerae]